MYELHVAAHWPAQAPRSTPSPAKTSAIHASALMAAASADTSTATKHTEEAQLAELVNREAGQTSEIELKVVRNELAGYRGAAVVLEPHTGEILAIVSMPAYDPNLFAKGIDQVRYTALQQDPNKPLPVIGE